MAKEIERKFLVTGAAWRAEAASAKHLRQAYLATTGLASIRIRIIDGSRALLTIKSANKGLVRDEFEYAVPVADAEAMLAIRSGEVIEKIRYAIPCAGCELVVDDFSGRNAGLVIAEAELPDSAAQPALPGWLGAEVTGDRRLYNADLSVRPVSDWPAEERREVGL